MDATNNFDSKNKIGDRRGAVYKGVLPDGVQIAVKRLLPESKQGAQDIITEIGTIYALQHQNLVRPIVYCPVEKQILLVYKYMENISLEHALFGSDEVKLDWQTRVKICLGIAKGLAFLHEEAKLHTIIHGNIKPSNILLDEDFDVKISDFGYSQLHDAQSKEQETTCGNMPRAKLKGYMAPEYIQGRHLPPKVDVYSFGIITLELVSGQNNITFSSKGQNIYLLNMAYQFQKQNNLVALVDRKLEKNYNLRQANIILDLAMDCVSPSFDLRPTMSHAVKVLEGKIKLKTRQTNTPPSHDLKMAESPAAFSQFTQLGSASQEGSDIALSLSISKEIDEGSVISPD